MSSSAHIGTDLLVKALDDELPPAERLAVDRHLAVCRECDAGYRELRAISVRLDAMVTAGSVGSREIEAGRRALLQALADRDSAERRRTGRSAGRSAAVWGLAAAAVLAIGLISLARYGTKRESAPASATRNSLAENFEIGDESFIPLPYSNADLPVAITHVVRMQVPVSSLLDAGVVIEPASRAAGPSDRSVLADVLVGIDGEPLGVHVIDTDEE
jgi:hypothetical protein